MSRGKRPSGASPKLDPKSAFSILEDLHVPAKGRKSSMDVEEQLHWRIFSDALAGDIPSIKVVLGWIDEREALRPGTGPNIQFATAYPHPKTADQALLSLGIASESPERSSRDHPHLELEPWFVDLALTRFDPEAFDERDMRDIRERTRPLNENDDAWNGGFHA